MNKYTLTFKHNEVEQQYQQKQPSLMKHAILIDIFAMIYMVYDVCYTFARGNRTVFETNFKIACLCCGIFMNIIAFVDRKEKKYFRACFFVANIFLMFQQMNADVTYPPQNAFNLGNNLMMINGMIVYFSDFIHGAIQIGSHLFITIGIAFYAKDPNINMASFIMTTVGVHLLWVWVHYTWTKSQRLSYILTLQQTQYETIIPKLMVQDFCLFTYDKAILSYELKLTNMFKTKYDLTQYLRRLKIKNTDGQTLENYLLQNKSEEISVEALDSQKSVQIEINEFPSGYRTFFFRIIRQSEMQIKESIIIKQEQFIKYLMVILKLQLKLLFNIFKVHKHILVAKGIIHLSEVMLKMNQMVFTESQDSHQIIKKMVQLFNFSSIEQYLFIRKWDQKKSKLTGQEQKSYMQILIELFNHLDQKQKYDLQIYSNLDYIGLAISTPLSSKLISSLQEISNQLEILIVRNQTRLHYHTYE